MAEAKRKSERELIMGRYVVTAPTLSDGEKYPLRLTVDGKLIISDPVVAAAVWDALQADHLAAGSMGKQISDIENYVDDLESRLTAVRAGYLDELDFDLDARLGTPAGASLAADLLTIDNLVDEVETLLKNATYGLSAIETLIDEVETLLKDATYGLSALNTDLDKLLTGIIQGTGTALPANKSLYDILGTGLTGASGYTLFDTPYITAILHVQRTAHPDMSSYNRIASIAYYDLNGAAPTASEISATTITIRKLRGAGYTIIVNTATMSRLDGEQYYYYNFPSTSWASGDKYSVYITSHTVVKNGKTVTIPRFWSFGEVP